MKRLILIAVLLTTSSTIFAKKVKFAVDMDTNTVSPNGVHVTGDFQAIAGYPGGDWTSNETICTQEGTSTIYSVIVDIPAFAKYEYKFVNGDQFYEIEFVPIESRVGYDFNDNRWLWVDSLGNDTSFVGAIKFSGNAPAGLNLVRYLVNMNNQTTISNRPHLAGNFQNWNPATTSLYSFGDSVFEIIQYLPSGAYEYKYINGNAWGVDETIPGACNVNGNRGISVSKDTVLDIYCFATCNSCNPLFVKRNETDVRITLFPNPMKEYAVLNLQNLNASIQIQLTDISGRVLRNYEATSYQRIYKNELLTGIYFVRINKDELTLETKKLIVE